MSKNSWFRMYHRIIDDEKIRLLSFEDRWHFVALCCLKGEGVLDDENAERRCKKMALKMGLARSEFEEAIRRLVDVELIDETGCPVAWNELQYKSDSSAERVKKHRQKQRASDVKRSCNVTVTPQDTDTDTDTEKKQTKKTPRQELETVLDSEHAQAVLDHRQRIRKPLTEHAARLLAGKFARCSDPNAAADAMIVNGWQGFELSWLENRQTNGRPEREHPNQDIIEAFARIAGEANQ